MSHLPSGQSHTKKQPRRNKVSARLNESITQQAGKKKTKTKPQVN